MIFLEEQIQEMENPNPGRQAKVVEVSATTGKSLAQNHLVATEILNTKACLIKL